MRPRPPRTRRPPARHSSSPTSDRSSPNTNSRKYLAGSQRRRRGRTALAHSWLSALDNQLTEGRALSILCTASELLQETEPTSTVRARATTAAGSNIFPARSAYKATSPNLVTFDSRRQRCGVILFIPNSTSVLLLTFQVHCLPFTLKVILLFKCNNFPIKVTSLFNINHFIV